MAGDYVQLAEAPGLPSAADLDVVAAEQAVREATRADASAERHIEYLAEPGSVVDELDYIDLAERALRDLAGADPCLSIPTVAPVERVTHEEAARRSFLAPSCCLAPTTTANFNPFPQDAFRPGTLIGFGRWNTWVEAAHAAGLLSSERAAALHLGGCQ